jgi:hypothetical protein
MVALFHDLLSWGCVFVYLLFGYTMIHWKLVKSLGLFHVDCSINFVWLCTIYIFCKMFWIHVILFFLWSPSICFFLVLVQIMRNYYMLHIVSYYYYFLVETYLFEHDMLLTSECVLFNKISCWYGSKDCSQKHKCQCKRWEWKDAFVFNMWKQP